MATARTVILPNGTTLTEGKSRTVQVGSVIYTETVSTVTAFPYHYYLMMKKQAELIK